MMLEITMENGEVFHMIESGAMVALLADTFPDKNLAPPPHVFSLERVDYLQMLHFGASSMDMILWQLRMHEDILPASERDDRTIRRYRKKFATEVEPQLKGRVIKMPFICGSEFSAADCIVGYNVLWAQAFSCALTGSSANTSREFWSAPHSSVPSRTGTNSSAQYPKNPRSRRNSLVDRQRLKA